ncbi:acyl-CoA dehydrogenase family protein [Pseudonocardia sp. GCM10023141]|uniref:acyl-CoA dehydrogenase family protein n=1 Tax=Pseudonocardia sp. GCM10023141 TaxID=3252653 RepID=UPI003615052A
MALALTPEHEELAQVVRAVAAAEDLRAATRAALETGTADPGPLWKRIGELGWLGLHLPEEHGGSGFGLPETAVVVEALAAAPMHGPFLSTVVASAVVAAVGTAQQRARLLPGLADGTVAASVPVAGGLQLGGRWAALHLVASGADDLTVATGPAGVPVPGLDPSLGLTRIAPTGVVDVLVGGAAVARRVLRVLAAAEASGGAHATLRTARDHAAVREQFGRPIGGFQAVKHHLADMLLRAELATAVAWDAARAAPGPAADLAAALAVVLAGDAYERNARMQIQVLGGIGFTWEHDAHLFLRRASALRALTGPAVGVEDEVAASVRSGVRLPQGVDLPEEAQRHRVEARAFVERFAAAAPEVRRGLLVESGYLVPHWPRPWGRAAGAVEQLVVEEELAGIDVPNLQIGGWVLLTILQTATAEQVEEIVGPGLRGEHRWCQLFSEPGAGSDAAAVSTRAVRADGGWRVTGQKVWTSDAQHCDRGLATVRTDPDRPKHQGITAMAIDLTAPGVTVRPLREITGDALFNEVFLDDVFVPDADVIGEVNGGWAVARATLGNERVTIGTLVDQYRSAFSLFELVDRYAPGDVGLHRQIAVLAARERAIELVNLREVQRAVQGLTQAATAVGSLTKLAVAEHTQHVTELAMRILGPAGVADAEPAVTTEYLFDRAMTIAGGTSEVSRNVIAERLLGLPREITPNAGARAGTGTTNRGG